MNKIAITGAAGRMGRVLIEAISQDTQSSLSIANEHADSSFLNIDAGELANIGTINIPIKTELTNNFDVLVDFTRPEACLEHLKFCLDQNKAIIIGTTGFSDTQKNIINQASTSIPIVFAPNMSVGVNLSFKLLEIAAKVMGEYTDIEIIESHHRHKVDAPSGTAIGMGEVIAKTLNRPLNKHGTFTRHGIMQERTRDEIGFSTIRAGDIVGEHTVMFADIGERLEITHKASSRMTFAKGAIRAANWITNKPAGLYNMLDVLDLN